ncbi:tetratricopeptide repeat protein [Motiliproteus sediminis]|uniref:tetratricopeptide repeat protein n=1 Tax=Motiliproteus sediminis TaxID=1468178 RepID=UPI001AEFAD82|nr:tetratricopeptide repeat protein [Motiliproteus sediminis]
MSNPSIKLLTIALVLALTGCGGANIKRAEQLQVGLPELQERVLVISPEGRAEYAAAVALLRNNQPYEARAALQQVIERHPQIPGAYLNLALLDFHEGFDDSARSRVNKALELLPRNAAAYNLSGTLYRREGKFRQAWEAYSLALAVDDSYAPAHLNLAILFDIYLQYWIDARTHYQRYLELTGEDEKVSLWLQDLDRRIKRAGG